MAQAGLNLLGAQRGCEFIILLPTTSQGLAVGAFTTTHRIIFIFKKIYPVDDIELEIGTLFFSFSYVSLQNLFNIVFVSDFSSIA